MAVYRVDFFTNEPQAVLNWVEDNFPPPMVIRNVGYKVTDGWVLKCVFKRQEDAEAFHRRWYPEVADHTVPAWK